MSLEEAAEELPNEYGVLEGKLRSGFNEAYFDQLCPAEEGVSFTTQTAFEPTSMQLSRAIAP